jgi:hypothetical protein
MSALAKIQRDFCQFVLGHGSQNFLQHMKPANLSKEAALSIYHHNILSIHFRSLSNDYPLVFAIMGEPTARAMVHAYVETSLPCTGTLEEWGGGLASFIQRYEPAVAWPYLGDIAQYEWARHIAYGAAEDAVLTPSGMSQHIALNQEAPNFRFQKSCQLLAFSHSLEQIIPICQQGQNPLPSEMQGSSYALIFKHEGVIKVHWLTPSLFVFVNRLKEGQGMEVAYAAAQVLDPCFDAQEAFRFLLSHPVLHA